MIRSTQICDMRIEYIEKARTIAKLFLTMLLVGLALSIDEPADKQFVAATGIILILIFFGRKILIQLNISE